MKLRPVVVIDSREQRPWAFPNLPSELGTLGVGDYAPKGLEHVAAIERKSAADLVQCVGARRAIWNESEAARAVLEAQDVLTCGA